MGPFVVKLSHTMIREVETLMKKNQNYPFLLVIRKLKKPLKVNCYKDLFFGSLTT